MNLDPNTMLTLLSIAIIWGRFEHRFTKLETTFYLLHPELRIKKEPK